MLENKIEPSLLKSFPKFDFLLVYTMRGHRSSNWVILLFKERLQRIEIKGQLRLEESIHYNTFFDDIMYGANLASVFNFLDTFGKCL